MKIIIATTGEVIDYGNDIEALREDIRSAIQVDAEAYDIVSELRVAQNLVNRLDGSHGLSDDVMEIVKQEVYKFNRISS